MHKTPLILASALAILVGATAVAAERADEHVLTVRMPDGGVEHIRYTGDVAPQIVFRPVADVAAAPVALFADDSPFVDLAGLSAAMDAQASAMMRQVSAMASAPATLANGAPQMAMLADAPAGAQFSYVSTTTANGKTCTTSVQSISQGAGKAPQLLRKVAGDCSTAMQRPTGPVPAVAPAPPSAPARIVPTSAAAAPKPPTVPADSI